MVATTRAGRLSAAAALALAVALLLGVAHRLNLLAAAQVTASDLLFATRPARPARSTVIVGIDQRSYQALLPEHGPLSQWPRTLYARVLDALVEPAGRTADVLREPRGPRVVAFEIFFDGPRHEDGSLAEAVRRAGNVVTPVVAQGAEAFDPAPGVAQRFQVFVRPARLVREAAAAEGLANITAARDSVVRSLPLLLRAGAEELPSMALTIAAMHARRPRVLDRPPAPGVVYAAGRAIPIGEADTMRIDFLGPPSRPGAGPVPVIPFADVLEGRFDRALVRDRIVLVGPTIRGVDEHPTPTSTHTRMYGVEVLAHAVETVVHQRYLVDAGPTATAVLTALAALAGAVLVALGGAWVAAAGVAAALVAYVTAAALLFDAGVLLDLVYPPAALVLTFALAFTYRVVFVESQQRMIRQAMGRYLSPAVGRWVLADPRRLALGGEMREMTILFSDLRDFTTLAHALPPETLVPLLNRYRSLMTAVVFGEDGVLAQYAGDAIEAFWNAPMDQADHARRACRAALGMVRALEALRPEFAARGWPGLDAGVGLNTGRVVVGNMGSAERIAYTAVGDAVNVAARLEGLTKEYGVHVVIGEDTRTAAGESMVCRFLDLVAVKGRPAPLRVWELLGERDAVDGAVLARLVRYHEAIEAYRARRWAEAEKRFAELEQEAPGDQPVALYRQRSREALDDPPPPDWDGVHVLRTK
jgi:adenylate cyclase